MLLRLHHRLRAIHPELPKYLAAVALMAVCSGIFENTYNNYLYQQFQIPPTTRGNLEFIREFPGLMNAFLMGALAALPETRVAAIAAVVTAIGMAGFGLKGHNWWLMLLFTICWGIGSHIIMPIKASLTMGFGGTTKRARRLGQVGAVAIVGTILGSGIVWLVFDRMGGDAPAVDGLAVIEKWQFDITFYIAALACVLAGAYFLSLRNVGSHTRRPTFVFKRKYWLYYVLNVLFGARKQVFMTFGRWVLVTVFRQAPSTFAKLSITASVIGIGFTPLVGRLTDRLGERIILVVDSFVLMLVCFGYAMARHLGLSEAGALMLVFICYVVDQLFFAVGLARETYMSKIAETPSDLTASLSVGVSINHIVAMSVPALGGLLWSAYGYEWVFVAAGVVAMLMTTFSAMIRVPRSVELQEAARDIPAGG